MRADRGRENLAVVARRAEPPDSLDYFPTPPWATRAFVQRLRAGGLLKDDHMIWEPACGEGHMAAVLAETNLTLATDIFPYGYGAQQDFLDDCPTKVDWIITNPPFNLSLGFAKLALERVRVGVAFIVRLSWLETAERYEFFHKYPPTLVYIHAGRVPMHKGRWEPKGKSATSYAWVVWLKWHVESNSFAPASLSWIRPDAKKAFSRPDDAVRFGAKTAAPLLEGGA